MEQDSGMERGFVILLEQVRSEVRLIAEGVVNLDRKVDQGFQDVRQEMAVGFGDARTAITELAKRIASHEHAHHS